ncbi:MAG: hypothetical protein FWD91_05825 [Treponema sp.]|nr:hypothetical protein [Treponema sp.]
MEAKRGPQRQLSLSEVLALNIMHFHLHVFDLKAFFRLAESSFKAYFPRMPNYENLIAYLRPLAEPAAIPDMRRESIRHYRTYTGYRLQYLHPQYRGRWNRARAGRGFRRRPAAGKGL